MERNYSLEVFCIILTVLLVTSSLFSKTDSTRTKYNFLLITIDTLRPDRLSCYSREHLKTPHIDSLAEKGVLFKKAFAHTPTTLPSHANILLGTTPLYHGVHDNSNFIVMKNI
ncbi:MAG: sulfatase-like hydrolase/transferase [Candidatus Aminicenantes bacterium]|nr:sulfatase-like hydrolase/transferase [Candidatus Aminicenantes bacterium]